MLWITWFDIVWKLRPAFSRQQTFFWSVLVIMSFCIRQDLNGVTSFIRASWIAPKFYTCMTGFFHSTGVNLNQLTCLWSSLCLKIFSSHLVKFNGKYVLLADGLKIPKEGKKMPGIKSHHQGSQNNSKPEYIMGHSFQAVSLLVKAADSFFAVPLTSRIHEGFKQSNRDHRTLFNKLLSLLNGMDMGGHYYFLADAYYSCKPMIKGLLQNDNHIISRMKSNAVAYERAVQENKGRGRPKIYGEKVILKNQFKNQKGFVSIVSPIYGEVDVFIEVKICDLILKGISKVVRYVLVKHPTRGNVILMSTDTNLKASEIVELYGLRFKIEVSFKESIHTVGAYSYRFWMKEMKKTRRWDGTRHLHKESAEYRKQFLKKINAYHLHVQFGLIAQGILQYLSINHPKEIWLTFGSWLRTIRPGIPPSEKVVTLSLRNGLLDFLTGRKIPSAFKIFMQARSDISRMPGHRMAS